MWPRLVSILVGVWLMAAPAVLGYGGAAADVGRGAGPLTAAFACIALWEVTRGLRWLNVPLGAVLLLAPWPLGFPPAAVASSVVSGAVLVALAFAGGRTRGRYGGGWSSLFRGPPRARPG